MAIKKTDLKDIAYRIIGETINCTDSFAFDNNKNISDDEVDYIIFIINKEADKYFNKIKNECIKSQENNTTTRLINCVCGEKIKSMKGGK